MLKSYNKQQMRLCMTLEHFDLENKLFYRLIKIIYVFFLSIALIFIFMSGNNLGPTKVINNDKSYLVCEHGLHTFKKMSFIIWSDDTLTLRSDDDEIARKTCLDDDITYLKYKDYIVKNSNQNSSKNITPSLARAELKRRELMRKTNPPPYAISLEYETFGSWISAIKFWVTWSIFTFFILNIFKQSILYV